MVLRGIKVLELAGLAPAPFCGMVLADFGAEVLRIDRLSHAALDPLSNGKKSLSLDLKNAEGRTILKKLCLQSDILIEPFRKGVMEKLGLGPEILLQENPRLIYARLTGYGQTGAYSSRAGHDLNYVGLSGLLSLFGRHSEKPTFPANIVADFGGGGLSCTLGILLALIERNSSGKGQVIDSSMVEGAAYLGSWLFRSQKFPFWGNERGRNVLDSGAHFYDVYETKDGLFMSVGAIESQFYELLLKGLELNSEQVPQFENFEENKKILAEKFKEKTQEEWCRIFENVDACVTPVLSLQGAAQHVHNKERQSFVTHDGGVVPKPAPVLSRTPGKTRAAEKAPELGEHTESVLEDLGYTRLEIKRLVENGAVGSPKKAKL